MRRVAERAKCVLREPNVLPLTAIGAALLALLFSAPHVHRAYGGHAWLALLSAWTLLMIAAARLAPRVKPATGLAIVLVVAALLRLELLLEPPYLSSDMYRYVWDGRVQAAGINPYLYVPAAPELAHLRDARIYPNINRANYAATIYPPVAQMVFWAITRLGDSVLVMKLGLLAFEAAGITAMIGLLGMLRQPTALVVAYAWHPLPVWEIAGNGHVDAILMALTFTGLWIALRSRERLGGAIVALAVFVKPTALLAMPVLWRPWDWRLPALLVATGAAVYAPYLSAGRRVFGFLAGYVEEEELGSGGGFRYLALVQSLVGKIPGATMIYLALAGTLLAWLALRSGFRRDRSPAATVHAFGVLVLAFLIVLTPHYPWYYLIAAPLMALTPWLTPWVLASGGFLLYDVIEGDRMLPFHLRETALHLAALVAVAVDLKRARGH